MRIDKYLKETRLIRRRKTSKDLTSANKVLVNDRSVKPSYEVKVNDVVEVKIKDAVIKFKVKLDPNKVRVHELDTTFEIIQD